ncbi:MAG: hypothetical protein IJ094_04425 [Bacilli bacterium]|nr:hypothetical protein [Bacilli bacterium]
MNNNDLKEGIKDLIKLNKENPKKAEEVLNTALINLGLVDELGNIISPYNEKKEVKKNSTKKMKLVLVDDNVN